MRYSIESRDRIYVESFGFLSFAKNIGTPATKVAKIMSNKYSQKLFDHAKQSAADTFKTASKRVTQKTAATTVDLTGNKIADKITNISKSPENASKELHSKIDENEIEIPKERYVSP